MINRISQQINEVAHNHGFWPETDDRNMLLGLKLALIHSEASESLEALRANHIEDMKTELADIVIRVLDLGYEMGFDMEEAIEDKMAKNTDRPYRHGKAF